MIDNLLKRPSPMELKSTVEDELAKAQALIKAGWVRKALDAIRAANAAAQELERRTVGLKPPRD
jgi:hypothetical protein